MVKVNNRQTILSQPKIKAKTISMLIAAIAWLQIPAHAGPQSLLDPYASIQPPQGQSESESLADGKTTKMPGAKSKPISVRPAGVKRSGQMASTTNSVSRNSSANPGFLSGIKEIQHGCVNSVKGTGHAIANSGKSVGAKIGPAVSKTRDGLGAAGHKIAAAPKALAAKTPFIKQKNQPGTIASASSRALPSKSFANASPDRFPGKPLAPIETRPTRAAKVKVNPAGKTNIVSRTFNKLNVFARHKNAQGNMTANNPNALSK